MNYYNSAGGCESDVSVLHEGRYGHLRSWPAHSYFVLPMVEFSPQL